MKGNTLKRSYPYSILFSTTEILLSHLSVAITKIKTKWRRLCASRGSGNLNCSATADTACPYSSNQSHRSPILPSVQCSYRASHSSTTTYSRTTYSYSSTYSRTVCSISSIKIHTPHNTPTQSLPLSIPIHRIMENKNLSKQPMHLKKIIALVCARSTTPYYNISL